MLCNFFLVLTEHAGSACSLTFAAFLAEICVHPHVLFFFFFHFEDASSPNPRWRCSLTPRWVSTEHSFRSSQTAPLVRQRGRDECYKSLTSEPHVRTHNMPWFFPRPRLRTANFTVILRHSRRFHRFTKLLLPVTELPLEAHILVQRRPSVMEIHIFDFVTRFAHKQKCLTAVALGFLIMVKMSKAAGRGSGGKC